MKFRGTVISLFSGAGGLDIGLKAAGFVPVVALEMDKFSCSTLRENFDQLPVLESPVEEVSSSEILRSAGARLKQVDLLVGGPPCQPFSKSSYWSKGDTRRLKDPRANTLNQFLRVLEDSLPKAFILENVSGLVYKGKSEGFNLIQKGIQSINRKKMVDYSISHKVLNTADFGVPQVRERTFIVGIRNGKKFQFPYPSFIDSSEASVDFFRQPYRNAWDAIGDLPQNGPKNEDLKVTGKWAELLPSIPEGENYLWHTDRKGGQPLFGWRTRYWSFLLKLSKRIPSWTIQAQPGSAIGPFHWKNRRLSAREMLRIQTFPDEFHIVGPRVEVQRQIGNAVPSLIAEVLGRAIREQVFKEDVCSEELFLLPPDRGKPPRANPIKSVPTKYLKLAGNHAAHPGTGKGPGAFANAQE